MGLYSGDPVRRKVYYRLTRDLKRGEVVRPETCDECELPLYVLPWHPMPEVDPTRIRWLCSRCLAQKMKDIDAARSEPDGVSPAWAVVVGKKKRKKADVRKKGWI